MKKRNTLITTLALTALLGGLVSCSSDSDSGTASEPPATDATDAEDTSAPAETTGADLSIFADKNIGLISLAPGLEPVDRLGKGVEDCVAVGNNPHVCNSCSYA